MKDAQKSDQVTLGNMIARLREGKYVIPDFQREFEWQPSDINELMRSIFRDYYIGSLLLWKGDSANYQTLACKAIYGFSGKEDRSFIVLDGQQRLTAMYYAMVAPDKPAPNRKNRYFYFIRVDRYIEEQDEEAFLYEWGNKGKSLVNDQTRQFEDHMFPLAVVGGEGWSLSNWAQGYEKYWQAEAESRIGDEVVEAGRHADNAKEFSKRLEEITSQYQISCIELDDDLELSKVCDIFTRINSRGVRLDIFDLINALLRPHKLRLKELWGEAAPRLEFVEAGSLNVYVLQVMSILRQGYCSPKYLYHLLPGNQRRLRDTDGELREETLVADPAEFKSLWLEAVEALERTIKMLRHPHGFGAIAYRYLPYTSILPAFASLQTEANRLPDAQQLQARNKIHLWYWASVFTARYSGSVESTTTRDYLDVKKWFSDDEAEPTSIGEFRMNPVERDLRGETKRGTAVYNGIFNLLAIQGARDWYTGDAPVHGELDDHHIVPKSRGGELALTTSIDTVLNRTPLSSETNRKFIGNRLPNEYLPKLVEANGEKAVLDVLESHLISRRAFDILMRNPFTPDDFEDFIEERRRTVVGRIEGLASNGVLTAC